MNQSTTPPRLTFEDAARIIYFNFCRNKATYMELMEDLLMNSGEPANSIAPRWQEAYQAHLEENKKVKG